MQGCILHEPRHRTYEYENSILEPNLCLTRMYVLYIIYVVQLYEVHGSSSTPDAA